jgi:hypothetical protein
MLLQHRNCTVGSAHPTKSASVALNSQLSAWCAQSGGNLRNAHPQLSTPNSYSVS